MAKINLCEHGVAAFLTAELVVVIPIYNEKDNIGNLVGEWTETFDSMGIDYQFLLINDGSTDSTLSVLERLEIDRPSRVVVVEKINSGHGRTCRLGYSAAVAAPSTKWILQIDSDGQCDPAYFPEFWRDREQSDCIFGRRIKRDDGMARAVTSKICKILATLLGGRDLVDPNVPYRLMRRSILETALKIIPPSFDIHNVAITFVLKRQQDLRWKYVPITFRDRQGGSNSINLVNVAHLGISMLLDLANLKKRL
jgi:glycosyltransferase involved in cell wall biosynthesis